MKFKNKLTQEVVEARGYVQEFAYTHNSNWEKVKEESKKNATKELKAKE